MATTTEWTQTTALENRTETSREIPWGDTQAVLLVHGCGVENKPYQTTIMSPIFIEGEPVDSAESTVMSPFVFLTNSTSEGLTRARAAAENARATVRLNPDKPVVIIMSGAFTNINNPTVSEASAGASDIRAICQREIAEGKIVVIEEPYSFETSTHTQSVLNVMRDGIDQLRDNATPITSITSGEVGKSNTRMQKIFPTENPFGSHSGRVDLYNRELRSIHGLNFAGTLSAEKALIDLHIPIVPTYKGSLFERLTLLPAIPGYYLNQPLEARMKFVGYINRLISLMGIPGLSLPRVYRGVTIGLAEKLRLAFDPERIYDGMHIDWKEVEEKQKRRLNPPVESTETPYPVELLATNKYSLHHPFRPIDSRQLPKHFPDKIISTLNPSPSELQNIFAGWRRINNNPLLRILDTTTNDTPLQQQYFAIKLLEYIGRNRNSVNIPNVVKQETAWADWWWAVGPYILAEGEKLRVDSETLISLVFEWGRSLDTTIYAQGHSKKETFLPHTKDTIARRFLTSVRNLTDMPPFRLTNNPSDLSHSIAQTVASNVLWEYDRERNFIPSWQERQQR